MRPLFRSCFGLILALAPASACSEQVLDVSGDEAAAGEVCTPQGVGDDDSQGCADGLACEPTADGYICAAPIELRGMVIDAITTAPIAGAVIAALDETGAPVGDAAQTDAMGNYVLRVSARRDAEGALASAVRWTLFAVASEYDAFPGGLRSPIPVDATAPVEITEDDEHVLSVVENPTTTVALLPLPDDRRGGVTVTGRVGGETPGGTLVVAEGGPAPARYTIADSSGAFVLFDVRDDATTIRGYRQGVELAQATISGSADVSDVELEVVRDGIDALAVVDGSANLVNASGDARTSVVLVPSSLFDPALERGPVPFGLRAPAPPAAPSISGSFAIPGVPTGAYHVLVAFENDDLVRDPDTGIAGTDLQQIAVEGTDAVSIEAGFKVTGALAVFGPGAELPEIVTAPPTLRWADDSSEDRYELRVIDGLGNIVWEDLEVPSVSGGGEVAVDYGGPALQPGMVYQFRATSMRETPTKVTPISRTEDLRGVFVFRP